MLRLLVLVGLFSQCTAQTYNFSYKDPVTCDWIQCETNDNSILSVFQINTTNSNEYIDHAVPEPEPEAEPEDRDCVGHLVNQTCSGGEKQELFIITTDAVNGGKCSYTNETVVNTYYDCPVSCVAQYVNQSCINGHRNETYVIQTLGANGGVECLYENETVVNTHDCSSADCTDSFLTDTVCNGHGNYASESKSCVCDTGYGGTYCCSCADGYTESTDTPGTCVAGDSVPATVNCEGSWGAFGECKNKNTVTFDSQTYEACEGAPVIVNFNGDHKICEVSETDYDSNTNTCINEYDSGNNVAKSVVGIGAKLGGDTRYFVCSNHPTYKFKISCTHANVFRKTQTFSVTTQASNGGADCDYSDGATQDKVCTVGCGTLGYDNYNASVEVPIKERCTCGRGKGANDVFTGCKNCTAENAEYNDDDASAWNELCATKACDAGEHLVVSESFFGLLSDYTCVLCGHGKYSTAGSGQCSPCDGIVTDNGGSCTTCGAGNYIDVNECKECSAGTYSDSANSNSCTNCPAGTYNDETGQTECKTCDSGYDLVGNTCIKQASVNSIQQKRTKIMSTTTSTTSVTQQERDTAIGTFDTLIRKTRDESKSQTTTNGIRTVEITVTSEEKTNMKVLAKSGNGALVRRSLVEAAKSEVGSGEAAVVKMDKTDFEEMFITDIVGTTDAAAILVNVVSVEMRTVKPKGTTTLSCNDADIHMEDVASNTLSEVLLENVDDMSLKCLNDQFETRLTLTSVDTDDVFKAECYDGKTWSIVSSALSHYDTYECNNNTHLVMSDTWTSPINPICVEVGQRVLMHDGTHKNVEHLVPGDVLRTPDGTTMVRGTRRGGRHLSSVHDVECAGKKGSITGNHAYHCEGEWRLPQDTHGPRALEGVTEVVAVETDNYCEDRMILESGLEVETWDGRGIDEWRPHSFENGRRLRCTLKGTWRDRVLQRVDSRQ